MKTVYSSFGRIVHGFWITEAAPPGPYVMDDFGNSVRVPNEAVAFFVRGTYASVQDPY